MLVFIIKLNIFATVDKTNYETNFLHTHFFSLRICLVFFSLTLIAILCTVFERSPLCVCAYIYLLVYINIYQHYVTSVKSLHRPVIYDVPTVTFPSIIIHSYSVYDYIIYPKCYFSFSRLMYIWVYAYNLTEAKGVLSRADSIIYCESFSLSLSSLSFSLHPLHDSSFFLNFVLLVTLDANKYIPPRTHSMKPNYVSTFFRFSPLSIFDLTLFSLDRIFLSM